MNHKLVLKRQNELNKFLSSSGLHDLEAFIMLSHTCKEILKHCALPDCAVEEIFDNLKKECLSGRNKTTKAVIDKLKKE